MDRFADLQEKISNISVYDIKSLYNQAKNAVLNISEMEAKVAEATNDDPWGASSTMMQEIAQGTFNFQQFNEIMPAIYARFMEKEARQWRQIYKALQLLEYLVKNGSERVVDDARSHVGTIKMLRNFYYVDEKGKDQGLNVRNRSKEIVDLLGDVETIRVERRKAKANRSKFVSGMSSASGGRYSGFGSDSMGSGGRSYDNYGEGGSGASGNSSSSSRPNFQEYDAGDDDIMPRRSNSIAGNTSSTRTSSTPQRSSTLPTNPPEPPKPKQPEVNLLDLDDDFNTGVSAPAPLTTLPMAGGAVPPTAIDDDFDDFQSAPPSAATPNTFLNPVTSASVVPTALPPPIAAASPPAMQVQVPPTSANFFGSSAMPNRTFTSPPAIPMQNPMNMMRPMMASPPPMTATPPTIMGMGAPMVPNQSMMSPTSPPARASSFTSGIGAASQPKSSSNFDDLWSMSLGGNKAGGGNATPQKSMKDLGKEKAQAQMWGGRQPQASTGAQGFAAGATNSNPPPSNGLDDLLF